MNKKDKSRHLQMDFYDMVRVIRASTYPQEHKDYLISEIAVLNEQERDDAVEAFRRTLEYVSLNKNYDTPTELADKTLFHLLEKTPQEIRRAYYEKDTRNPAADTNSAVEQKARKRTMGEEISRIDDLTKAMNDNKLIAFVYWFVYFVIFLYLWGTYRHGRNDLVANGILAMLLYAIPGYWIYSVRKRLKKKIRAAEAEAAGWRRAAE